MSKYAYTVHLQQEPEGGVTVMAPAPPGLVTYGESYDVAMAMAMAEDAIRCYIASLEKDGEPVPVDAEVSAQELVSRIVLEADSVTA